MQSKLVNRKSTKKLLTSFQTTERHVFNPTTSSESEIEGKKIVISSNNKAILSLAQ